jgi:hypothetical protein
MAKRGGGGAGGWLNPVIGIIFAIIFLSVLIGVGFIVEVQVSSTLASTTGANVAIGTSGTSALTAYNSVAQNLVTLVNFLTIIVLLAIVSVVLLVLALAMGGFMGGGVRA